MVPALLVTARDLDNTYGRGAITMHDTREPEAAQDPTPLQAPSTLYRFFDAEGSLLYVGITELGAARWYDHRENKPWWTSVASCTLEHFGSRREVERAEAEAIEAEKPRFNWNHDRSRAKGSRRRTPTGVVPAEELLANAQLRAEAMAERDRLIMEALAAGATKRRVGALAGLSGPGVLHVERRMNGEARPHPRYNHRDRWA